MLRKRRKRSGWQLEQLQSQRKKRHKKWLKKQPVCKLYSTLICCALLCSINSTVPYTTLYCRILQWLVVSFSLLLSSNVIISATLCTSCLHLTHHNLPCPALPCPAFCPALPRPFMYFTALTPLHCTTTYRPKEEKRAQSPENDGSWSWCRGGDRNRDRDRDRVGYIPPGEC